MHGTNLAALIWEYTIKYKVRSKYKADEFLGIGQNWRVNV